MEQSHARALSALQPFIHLGLTTKAPTHRFLADLIVRATSAQGTYVFTELLQLPAIQSLRSADTAPEFRAHLTLLEIFSYGTFEEYQATEGLPPLNELQTLKLRQLSILSIASQPVPLTYSNLISLLSLDSPALLESLLTSAIYSGLLTARLSPTSTPPTIHITSVAPLRDLRPQSLSEMLAVLQVWEQRCSGVVDELEAQIQGIRDAALKRQTAAKKQEAIVDHAVLDTEVDLMKPATTAGGGAGGVLGGGRPLRAGTDNATGKRSPIEETMGRPSLRGGRGSITAGNKRELEESQDDDDGAGGGVEVEVAKLEVDEGVGAGGKSEGARSSKRVLGKKGL